MNEPSQRTYLSWQRGHHRLVLAQGGGRSPEHEYYGRAWQGRGCGPGWDAILGQTKDKNNACCKGWGVLAFWKSTDYRTALIISALFSWIKSRTLLTIPNEALKNQNYKLLFQKFFNLCFISGLNPTEWDTSDIKPIPKKDKDSRDPLQNRCITIMCCVAKLYSSILNKRLQLYLEKNHLLVEEQNGFRATRSCLDHALVLFSILRNWKSLGLKHLFHL